MTSLMIFNRPHLLLFHSFPPFRHIPCFFFFFSSNIPTFFRRCTGSPSFSFMEVVKAISRRASLTNKDTALRFEKFTYSYSQLIGSAWHISYILGSGGLDSISREERDQTSSPLKVQISGKDGLKGARIGIVATPSAEFVAGLLGTWLSGGVAVPLALSYPEAELMHVMKDSDIAMILGTEEHQELMKIVAFKCVAGFSLIPPVSSYLLENLELGLDNLCCNIESFKVVEGEEPALIIYTSGTTGKPKGVVHTNKSILSQFPIYQTGQQILCNQEFCGAYATIRIIFPIPQMQVQILTEAWAYSSSDHFLNCLPLHHVHGLFNALLAPLYAGSVVEFMPKFSVRGIWQRWRESYPSDGSQVDNAITVFTGVPTMYTRLLQGYEVMNSDMQAASASAAHNLRLMMCGSSALPYPVMKQWEAITGHRLLERYGMTEFVMALSNPLRGLRKGGTVGQPLPGVQLKIISEDESGNGTSGVGELCVKSPSLFKEYWKQPKITAESFVDDSFFKTGDSVRVDEEGYYIILGRTNADIMKVGGYKLSALEIEAVLLEHPSVSECCVLGLPDKDYGEVVCAIVIPNANVKKEEEDACQSVISLGELQGWAKDKLAPYKLPTRLFLWDTLPRNAMGKVNKKELKKLLAESYT